MKNLHDFIQQALREAERDVQDMASQGMENMINRLLNSGELARMMQGMIGSGMNPDQVAGMLHNMQEGKGDPYAVLGLERGCSDDEVRERYRDLMKIIHPDVTGGKTEYWAKELNSAYKEICEERGIK